jgi:repressor of nif and glnA expression
MEMRRVAESGESTRKEVEILRVLSEFDKPVGSTVLKEELGKRGFLLSERTIRYHLQLLEMKGLILGHERSGRTITPQGLEEVGRALASQRLGFIVTRFLSLAYSVTYDPKADSGAVVTNVSIMDKAYHDKMLEAVKALREMNLLPAPYIKVLDEKEEYQEISVPEGRIALLTVCDLTIDGILIHQGIPLFFKCGGLVQMINRKPIRFVDIIAYEGTTIPPLEVFMSSNRTSITKVLKTGSGMLPVVLREILADARERTVKVTADLAKKGWGGVLVLGEPNEPVLGVPIVMDRFGLAMIGGLVPAAAMMEEGVKVEGSAPHCLVPIQEMTRI